MKNCKFVNKTRSIAIVGGGPSGLSAAIAASRVFDDKCKNCQIVIFDENSKVGKTILRTGNGRCNITNSSLDINKFLNSDFVSSFFEEDENGIVKNNPIINFCKSIGLELIVKNTGEVFPFSNSAKTVRDAFQRALNPKFIKTVLNEKINSLSQLSDFDQIIVSTGSSLFEMCEFSKLRKPFKGILCPIICVEKDLRDLDGLRVRCNVKLFRKDRCVFEESGEVLFRKYGLSGIVIFNASRFAKKEDKIVLDSSNMSFDKSRNYDYYRDRFIRLGSTSQNFMQGLLDERLNKVIIKRINNIKSFDDIYHAITHFECTVKSLKSEKELSQVSRGGIFVENLNSNLRVKDVKSMKHVYVCGEAVDVDGPCGGYNLSWAIRSGEVAGISAAQYLCGLKEV